MDPAYALPRSAAARAVYSLLNPIPFGFFVAALIFDVLYAQSGVLLWDHGAAWLIVFGLLFAVIPRLINLVEVWITARRAVQREDRLGFWLNLIAIVAAIFNAFVHSRDAYAVVPLGVWLSACTVLLLAVNQVVMALRRLPSEGAVHA